MGSQNHQKPSSFCKLNNTHFSLPDSYICIFISCKKWVHRLCLTIFFIRILCPIIMHFSFQAGKEWQIVWMTKDLSEEILSGLRVVIPQSPFCSIFTQLSFVRVVMIDYHGGSLRMVVSWQKSFCKYLSLGLGSPLACFQRRGYAILWLHLQLASGSMQGQPFCLGGNKKEGS